MLFFSRLLLLWPLRPPPPIVGAQEIQLLNSKMFRPLLGFFNPFLTITAPPALFDILSISIFCKTDGPKCPLNDLGKVSTFWTCQTYMETMFTELKPEESSFEVLFFWQKLCQLRTILELLPHTLI